MTYKGHLAGGAAAAVAASQTLPVEGPTLIAVVGAVLLGSLAPDIDHARSYISQRVGPLYHVFLYPLFSNPLVWWFVGQQQLTPRRVTTNRKFHWFFRLFFYNPLHKTLLGEKRALRWATILELGRKRMKEILGHRAITHSIAGTLVATALAGGLFLGGQVLLNMHAPDVAEYLHYGMLGMPTWWPLDFPLVSVLTVGFLFGYISHILLDMMTVSGVPLLTPVSKKKFWVLPSWMRVKTR